MLVTDMLTVDRATRLLLLAAGRERCQASQPSQHRIRGRRLAVRLCSGDYAYEGCSADERTERRAQSR
jgi:hypothetical protein